MLRILIKNENTTNQTTPVTHTCQVESIERNFRQPGSYKQKQVLHELLNST